MTRSNPPARRRQRGAIAILTALALVVLIGFAGLALDGGHLYLTKTELQNAADSCALAAAFELTGTPIAAEQFQRADDAGRAVGKENAVDFQGSGIPAADFEIGFGTALSGGSWSAAGSAPGNAKFVRCVIRRTGIAPWFMQVLGFGEQTVAALATATLANSQNNCAIPMGLCTAAGSTPPDHGYVKGRWYSMNFSEKGSSGYENLTGNFRWIDFDPSAATPGCSGGGAQELACLFEGAGQCSLPPEGPPVCASGGSSQAAPGCVGQTGNIQSLGKAFNSRFGICQGGSCSESDLRNAPPDFTGYAYTASSWPAGCGAYGLDWPAGCASGGQPRTNHFGSARTQHLTVQNTERPSGTASASTAQLVAHGADRRLVTLPFVQCDNFAGGQHAPVRGYACVLMLSPYKKSGSTVQVQAEYLGASNEPGSPCATAGLAGSATSVGPLVPALVQ